jgi:hypothetical protein
VGEYVGAVRFAGQGVRGPASVPALLERLHPDAAYKRWDNIRAAYVLESQDT